MPVLENNIKMKNKSSHHENENIHYVIPEKGEEICITGMAGKFPNSNDVYHFRDNLFNKVDMVSGDYRRWKPTHPEIPQRTGKLYNIEKFDCGFFGISSSQGDNMDPSMRLILERVFEAIIDSGQHPSDLENTNTGVFVGCCGAETEKFVYFEVLTPFIHTILNTHKSMVARRISYFLKLKGPAMGFDTACSSSLFALEQAYIAMREGLCEKTIVCGNNLCLHPIVSLQFARLGVLSRDGACKSFDANGNGYVRSEGIVVLILEKAKYANRIYSEVIHVKSNCDGYKRDGITFPSSSDQKLLMRDFYAECKVDPKTLTFIEAHGTGTEVGDPEELETLDEIFCKGRNRPLYIGALKSNIGHNEPASGLSSVVKVLLGMETGFIPPNINYEKPLKGARGLEEGRIIVVTDKMPLPDNRGLFGVNNFGFGGGNAHALLRWNQKSKVDARRPHDGLPRLICVSSRVEEGVNFILDDFRSRECDTEYAYLIQHAFRKSVENHLYRGYAIYDKRGEIKRSCSETKLEKRKLYLIFSNFSGEWLTLGPPLMKILTFQKTIKSIQNILQEVVGSNAFDIVTNLNEGNVINEIIASTAIQIGLANLLKEINLSPYRIIGTGSGEFIAAYLDNYLTLKQTVLGLFYAASNLCNSCQKNVDILRKIFSTGKNSYEKWIPINEDKLHTDCVNYFANSVTFSNGYYVNELIPEGALPLVVGDIFKDLLRNSMKLIDLNSKDFIVDLLENLGSLYECGYDMELEKLYPAVELPVSRGTPMLSPLIKWNHDDDRRVYLYQSVGTVRAGRRVIYVVPKDEVWSFVVGHVIDGRNLFPATGYLTLVWETLAMMENKKTAEMKVGFEDVRYIRAANILKDGSMELTVTIESGTHLFEVSEGGVPIATGRIYDMKPEQVADALPIFTHDESDLYLSEKDVYKELKLRGYHYSGMFRNIKKCTQECDFAIVEWENNWICFMDAILQLTILQRDTRTLYIPTSIGQMVIDGPKHINMSVKYGGMMPAHIHKTGKVISVGGIVLTGLGYSAVPRKKYAIPVLEASKFISNVSSLTLQDSVRSLVQLVLENSNTLKVKVVELLAENRTEDDLLCILIQNSLDDVPLVQQDITVLSRKLLDIPRVVVQNNSLASQTHCSILVVSNLLETVEISTALTAVQDVKGFVITREDRGVNFLKFSQTPFKILASYTCAMETLVLLSPALETHEDKQYFDLTNAVDNLDVWIPKLQKLIKENKSIILYAQNDELTGILGFAMCLRRELANKVSCFVIMDDAPKFDPKLNFYKQQLEKNMGINIWKDGSWGTYRHLLLPHVQLVEVEHSYVNVTTRGDLSTLTWLEGSYTSEDRLPPDEDCVHIYYAALNFRDVMTATGKILPDTIVDNRIEQECVQGFEFSGRNSKGERVMGVSANGALATLRPCVVMLPIPDHWTLEDAATVLVTYGTIAEILLRKYRPKRGQSILIHSGAGGVGQAAINLCLHFGLTVFVTVGTKDKRDFIREYYPQIKEEHILNSRDTSFEDMVHQYTGGRGVDYVLNSLAEEKLIASIRCLARGGKFLEIGKFDVANNSTLPLDLLEKEVEFSEIALDRHILESHLARHAYKEELSELLARGAIKPLPRTVFKSDEVEKAFRYMGTGKHIGKVLIKIRDEEDVKVCPVPRKLTKAVPRFYCKPECSYLICGGLGGFGLELADFLVIRGAKKLILTSTSGICNGYQRLRIRAWKGYGVKVVTTTQDASTEEGCMKLLNLANELAPVDGIFNLAAVLKDALFENHSAENFKTSLIPKAYSTKNLDSISRRLCPNLRYFVLFSSVSCGHGNVGQTNYGMANSIMERICEKRKREGYPAVAIQWGAIGEVGLVAKMQEDHRELVIGGTLQQSVASCLEVLDKFLRQDEAVVASMLVAEKRFGGKDSNLFDVVVDIMGIRNLKSVSMHSTFPELGMDSMMAVEIKQILEREYEVLLTAQDIKGMTLSKLKELAKIPESITNVKESVAQYDLPIDVKLLLNYVGDEKFDNIPVRNLNTSADTNENEPHIFMLPGLEGIATTLEPLCEKLKARVSCLQYCNNVRMKTVADLVEALLPHIESTTGDLILLAHSYGCVLATELLYILEAKGRIAKAIFIDGSPQLMYDMVKAYFPTDNDNNFQILLLSTLMMRYMPYEEIIKHQERFMQINTYEDKIDYFISVSPQVETSMQTIKQKCISSYERLKALSNYKIKTEKLKSHVTLFKAKTPPALKTAPDYGLSNTFENGATVITVDGDHVTMLTDEDLVKEMNKILES